MAPIVTTFLSMISFFLLAADRTALQVQGSSELPLLKAVDDGVPQTVVDVAKRTVPWKLSPSRTALTIPRRMPRSAPETWLRIRALRKRDIRDQLWGPASRTTKAKNTNRTTKKSRVRPKPQRVSGLGELQDDLMVHGRDRAQLQRRWKIEDANTRVANVHG